MWRVIVVTGLGLLAFGGARAKDPDTQFTPAQLVEAFLTNEAYADENLVGRELEVTGKIVRVSRAKGPPDPEAGHYYVLELDQEKAGRTERVDLDLLLAFGERDRAQLAKLKPGQVVVARGRCGSRVVWSAEARNKDKDYSQVYLSGCRLVEAKE
jgi:hypothetical protein